MSGKFFLALRELRNGATIDDLDSALAEVVAAVKATDKPGEIILRIKLRPPRKAGTRYVSVEDEVVVKVPKRDRADTIFFPLADNSLSKNDPNQRSLDLRLVENVNNDKVPPADATVDPTTGEVIAGNSAT